MAALAPPLASRHALLFDAVSNDNDDALERMIGMEGVRGVDKPTVPRAQLRVLQEFLAVRNEHGGKNAHVFPALVFPPITAVSFTTLRSYLCELSMRWQ